MTYNRMVALRSVGNTFAVSIDEVLKSQTGIDREPPAEDANQDSPAEYADQGGQSMAIVTYTNGTEDLGLVREPL